MEDDDQAYLPDERDDVGWIFPIALVGVLFAIVFSAIFVRPTSPPPPAELTGCFVAPNAPTLRFGGRMLYFGQSDIQAVPYRLALAKYGTIDVVTDRPVSLDQLGERFVFVAGKQKTIVFGSLAHIENDRTFGVTAVRDAEFLNVLSSTAEDVRYDRANDKECRQAVRA